MLFRGSRTDQTLGWRPSCDCGADIVPATVLDPFLGSGTTALVAIEEGRKCIGIELSQPYVELSIKRLLVKAPLFASAGRKEIDNPGGAR